MNISFSGLITNEPVAEYSGQSDMSAADTGVSEFETFVEQGDKGHVVDCAAAQEKVDCNIDDLPSADGEVEPAEDPEAAAVSASEDNVAADEPLVDVASVEENMEIPTSVVSDFQGADSLAPDHDMRSVPVDGDNHDRDPDFAPAEAFWDVRLSGPNDIQSFDDTFVSETSVVMPVDAEGAHMMPLQGKTGNALPVVDGAGAGRDAMNIPGEARTQSTQLSPDRGVATGTPEPDVSVDHQPAQQKTDIQGARVAHDNTSGQTSLSGHSDFATMIDAEKAPGLASVRTEFGAERGVGPQKEGTTPQSPIVQKVTEQISRIPTENGTTTIRLKPHGMGAIEITVEKAANGHLEVDLKVQNPLVLEAMRAERGAIAHLFSSQANGGGGSLSMELMNPGGGQGRSPKEGGNAGGAEGELDAPAREDDMDAPNETGRIHIGTGSLNILT